MSPIRSLNPPCHTATIYPTPPPFSSYTYENN